MKVHFVSAFERNKNQAADFTLLGDTQALLTNPGLRIYGN